MEGGGMDHNMKRRTGISGVLSHHDHDPSHSHYGNNIATNIGPVEGSISILTDSHTNLDSDDFTHSADTMERKGPIVLSPRARRILPNLLFSRVSDPPQL